jgi:hypothetical protein
MDAKSPAQTKTENVYSFITREETAYQTLGVPVIDGWEWHMFDHIKKSTLYKNSKFFDGKDDGNRPFKNIIRPILNVAYRSEGFDVKDINPFVDDADNYYKSFLVKKFHVKWARNNDIDTFIDDVVESYVDYGGVLVKEVNEVRPEVVPLQRLAFCDQTDILSGPICEKHMYAPDQLLEMTKWDADKIDEAITMAREEKSNSQSNNVKAKTPGKYIEVYELHGMFPETWLDDSGNPDKYTRQFHVITFYKDTNSNKNGITLYKGKEKNPYKFLARDKIYGRALGFGGIEELFEAQIWTNYSEIQIKEMLDVAAMMIVQTYDKTFVGRHSLTDMKKGEIVTTEPNAPLNFLQIPAANINLFEQKLRSWDLQGKTTGSANDAQMGINPSSGTPFALENLITATGQGLHEYRRGKIATFVGEMYRDWFLDDLAAEMNKGDKWLVELDLDEMQFVAEAISTKQANNEAVKMVINYFDGKGEAPSQEEIDAFKEVAKQDFIKGGKKRFLEIVKDELKSIPIDVDVNVAGKQAYNDKVTDKLTNIFRQIIANPMAFQQTMQLPGMGKVFNEILEYAGLSPVDFVGMTVAQPAQQMQQPQQPQQQINQPQQAQPQAVTQ